MLTSPNFVCHNKRKDMSNDIGMNSPSPVVLHRFCSGSIYN